MKKIKLLFTSLLLFLFLGIGSLQAQSFITSDEAMTKLELKLADVYNQEAQGTVLTIDKEIADKFINKTAIEISNSHSIETALDKAYSTTLKSYALYRVNVMALKAEITSLLEIEKKD